MQLSSREGKHLFQRVLGQQNNDGVTFTQKLET